MIWSYEGILKRERTHPGGNHVTDGKIVGSLKRGVSLDWSPGSIDLHIGRLSGPSRERKTFSLGVKEARELGLSLLTAAAELQVAVDRQAEHRRERKREEKAAVRRAKQKPSSK
jgi:hypothetical protein